MVFYLIVILGALGCIVPAVLYVLDKHYEKKLSAKRADPIRSHERARVVLHTFRYSVRHSRNDKVDLGSMISALISWSERHDKMIKSFEESIRINEDKIRLLMECVTENDRLIKKMSVIVLNQQEKVK